MRYNKANVRRRGFVLIRQRVFFVRLSLYIRILNCMNWNDLEMTWFDLYNNLFQRLAFLLVHSALSVYSATTRFTETVDSIILIENQLKQNDSIYSLNDQITTQENGPTRKYFFDFCDFFVDNRKVQIFGRFWRKCCRFRPNRFVRLNRLSNEFRWSDDL